jgi:hypothetical protein
MSDLQSLPTAGTITDPPALCESGGSTAHKGFSTAELSTLVKMLKAGKTQAQIAQALGCSQQNVSYHLQQLGSDTRELAEYVMDASLFDDAQRLDAVVKKGKDGDAVKAIKLKWQARKVVDSTTSGNAHQVLVQVGVSGIPVMTAQGAKVSVLTSSSPQVVDSIE